MFYHFGSTVLIEIIRKNKNLYQTVLKGANFQLVNKMTVYLIKSKARKAPGLHSA